MPIHSLIWLAFFISGGYKPSQDSILLSAENKYAERNITFPSSVSSCIKEVMQPVKHSKRVITLYINAENRSDSLAGIGVYLESSTNRKKTLRLASLYIPASGPAAAYHSSASGYSIELNSFLVNTDNTPFFGASLIRLRLVYLHPPDRIGSSGTVIVRKIQVKCKTLE
jgi:hypothetical protein